MFAARDSLKGPFLLLAAAFGMAAAPPTNEERSEVRAQLAAACGELPREIGDEELIVYAQRLAYSTPAGRPPCRSRPELALRIAAAIAEAPSVASLDAYRLLAQMYGDGRGVKRDRERSRFYLRRAAILGRGVLGVTVVANAEERRALLAADETIAFLRERAARGSAAPEQVELARALTIRRAPGDVAEARKLLKQPAAAHWPEARRLLAETVLDQPATNEELAEAAATLRPFVASPGSAESTLPLVHRIARLQLARAGTPAERWDAIQSLAAAAYRRDPDALREFEAAVRKENGDRDPASLATVVSVRARATAEDYPPMAIRQGLGGTASLRGLLDPRGRIIFTEGTDPSEPQLLVEGVRRIYARQRLPEVTISEPRPTPYVWVRLPRVAFSLPE